MSETHASDKKLRKAEHLAKNLPEDLKAIWKEPLEHLKVQALEFVRDNVDALTASEADLVSAVTAKFKIDKSHPVFEVLRKELLQARDKRIHELSRDVYSLKEKVENFQRSTFGLKQRDSKNV